MSRNIIKLWTVLGALFCASGCCGGLKAAVHDQAVSIHKTAEPSLPLTDACKTGNAIACDTARANVSAIDEAAVKIEADSK